MRDLLAGLAPIGKPSQRIATSTVGTAAVVVLDALTDENAGFTTRRFRIVNVSETASLWVIDHYPGALPSPMPQGWRVLPRGEFEIPVVGTMAVAVVSDVADTPFDARVSDVLTP